MRRCTGLPLLFVVCLALLSLCESRLTAQESTDDYIKRLRQKRKGQVAPELAKPTPAVTAPDPVADDGADDYIKRLRRKRGGTPAGQPAETTAPEPAKPTFTPEGESGADDYVTKLRKRRDRQRAEKLQDAVQSADAAGEHDLDSVEKQLVAALKLVGSAGRQCRGRKMRLRNELFDAQEAKQVVEQVFTRFVAAVANEDREQFLPLCSASWLASPVRDRSGLGQTNLSFALSPEGRSFYRALRASDTRVYGTVARVMIEGKRKLPALYFEQEDAAWRLVDPADLLERHAAARRANLEEAFAGGDASPATAPQRNELSAALRGLTAAAGARDVRGILEHISIVDLAMHGGKAGGRTELQHFGRTVVRVLVSAPFRKRINTPDAAFLVAYGGGVALVRLGGQNLDLYWARKQAGWTLIHVSPLDTLQ